jgi:formimidoylglutamate deiminase
VSSSHHPAQRLWAASAWLNGAWAHKVLLHVGDDGCWSHIAANTPLAQATADQDQVPVTVLPGAVLPGLVNAHSHAFQRAFVGLAERHENKSDGTPDDFWSWRERMYAVALRISPQQLQAVATQLYAELLCGGYTHVCEFHYLHHAPDGTPYADPLTMCRALAQAAQDTGIGLTILPVLYERAGFGPTGLRPEQRRFATTVQDVLALRDGVRALNAPLVQAGVAVHSLRAAHAHSIQALATQLRGDDGPIHIHVAEQMGEVTDCQQATGARPIEWLTREVKLDARWHLVHATHSTPAEIDAVARSGAGVVLCPSTEANLGDGLCDLPRWLSSGTPLSIGSDSHVSRSLTEELRWLEYGQRLHLQRRNVAASMNADQSANQSANQSADQSANQAAGPGPTASATRLLSLALAGGAAAAGCKTWGLQVGARADALVLDENSGGVLGVPPSHTLDALVFATGAPAFAQVWVAGRCVVTGGQHIGQAHIAPPFVAAMQALWGPTPSIFCKTALPDGVQT